MSVSTKKKLQKVMINNSSDGRSLDIDTCIMWEKAAGVNEVKEAVLDLVAVERASKAKSLLVKNVNRVVNGQGPMIFKDAKLLFEEV